MTRLSTYPSGPSRHLSQYRPESDEEFAKRLGISTEAVALTRRSDFIDLHLDSFIPPRLWGYDLQFRHGSFPFAGRFFGHSDFVRALDGGLTGGLWSITTNPFRSAASRWRVFLKNLTRFQDVIASTQGKYRIVNNLAQYHEARRDGAHGCFLSIQGGNALEAAPDGPASIPGQAIVRVTLVHLTNSVFGVTSSPLAGRQANNGLTTKGKEFVQQLNTQRILVDLAHINPKGFWDAVAVSDRSLPIVATHTGVSGVCPHWRNLDDAQIRAIADSGGVVGIIFANQFLHYKNGPPDGRIVIEHMRHVLRLVGDEYIAVGSDFDGAITPPADLRTADAYPRLVQHMLNEGWGQERIQRILGKNIIRVLSMIRPGTPN